MKEDLLQYIWQFQLFDKSALRSLSGESINIIQAGTLNHHDGPDFFQAQIKIDDLVWFGSVEIHIRAQDWRYHQHHRDPKYENVILHVIWEGDEEIKRADGTKITTLELKPLVNVSLIERYQAFVKDKSSPGLACEYHLPQITDLVKFSTLEKAGVSRIERKANELLSLWEKCDKDWDQIAFQYCCRAFGGKLNADSFYTLGEKISWKLIQKESITFKNLLSLMIAVSGMETDFKSLKISPQTQTYFNLKYQLHHKKMQAHEFRKARMRPANAPALKIIHLAAFIYVCKNLRRFMQNTTDIASINELFETVNDELRKHEDLLPKIIAIGDSSIHHFIINALVPFRYALGSYYNDLHMQESCISILEQLPVEKNNISKIFATQNFKLKSAFDSQAAIEQYQMYCQNKKCLECRIGNSIMKQSFKHLA